MAEYIDRQAAIEIASGYCHPANIAAELAKLPAAYVRPVVLGKWEHFGSDVFRCSECGYGILPWNVGVNFCPNCGAEMRPEPPKEE